MADQEQTAPAAEPPSLDIESTVEDIADSLMPREEEEGSAAAAGEVEQAGQEAAAAPPAEAEKEPGSVDTIPASIVDAPPDTWRKEAKEAWASVPPVVREEMRKRESDIAGYVERVKTPVAVGQALEEIIKPYLPMFQATNTDPWENMKAMFAIQERLVNGSPEQKLAIVHAFAKQAGLNIENGQVSAPTDSTAQYVRQLEQRLGQLEGGVKGVTSIVHEARVSELQQHIRKFAEDTEAHPYFHEVSDEITRLINAGVARDLEHAYQLACASDAVVRQKSIDAAVAKAADTRAKADQEKVEKAKATSKTRVRSRATVATQQPLGNIDDTLKATLAEINAR